MKRFLRPAMAAFLCLLMLLPLLPQSVLAEETTAATDISSVSLVEEAVGFKDLKKLFDEEYYMWERVDAPGSLTLSHNGGIGSLYVMFTFTYGEYTLTDLDTGKSVTCGEYSFLNDYLDLVALFGHAPKRVKLSFDHDTVVIRELYAFTEGEVPSFVQKWKPPVEGEADLVLFSTHGDDEHLFFAGILPYYGVERGYNVQVVYLTDHHNNNGDVRNLEMLAGLWNVGLDTYPVFGPFEDFYYEEIHKVYTGFRVCGHSKEDLLGFVVENLRRFRPMVAVGHDFAGEYGHGQHKVYAELLAEAIEISMDPEMFPESAEKYGVWDVPKTYIHLLKDNEIIMDWDQPLEKFGGKTAFEVSIYQGFVSHQTQIMGLYKLYYGYDKAIELPRYNPCYYGLYRTTVGPDVEKNDFFENAITHAEVARLAEEARLAAEAEAKRLEAELEAQLRAEAARKRNTVIVIVSGAVLVAVLTVCLIRIRRKKK